MAFLTPSTKPWYDISFQCNWPFSSWCQKESWSDSARLADYNKQNKWLWLKIGYPKIWCLMIILVIKGTIFLEPPHFQISLAELHQTAWLLQRCGSASSQPEGVQIGLTLKRGKPNAKTHPQKRIPGCDFNHPHTARFMAAKWFPTLADSVSSKCSYPIHECVQSLTDWMLRMLKAMRSKHHQGHTHTHTTVSSNSCPLFLSSPLSCCFFCPHFDPSMM